LGTYLTLRIQHEDNWGYAKHMIVPELFSVRFILGCIFLASSVWKFSSFRTFADEILDYQLLSERQAQIIAYLLPFVELALGLLCIVGFGLGPVSIFAIFLLLIFTGAIAINLIRGRRFSCHCFGSSSAMIGPVTIVRNLALVALAFWMFLHASMTLSFSSLVALWQSEILQFAHVDTLAPLVAAIFLSLGIFFLLGEIDTFLYEYNTSTRDMKFE
jgi:Methylamine utilisation protein MauE